MYGIPKDLDLGFVLGAELQQIAFGLYQLILRFSLEVEISIESTCEIRTSDNTVISWSSGNVETVAQFGRLLTRSVTGYVIEEGVLIIVFDNGDKLVLADGNSKYESFQITGRGKTIVV